ncbi:hypothetical protein IMSAGC006_01274 [Muribaculaceae bacterium]|nr:hypothetical protein IMSAGC006_01274 [Muribaculaceae bacterium]
MEAMSSEITRLPKRMRLTLRWTIRNASPSTIADLPTPGSPMSTGLFFLRRLSIWASLSISTSRPTTGSRRPSSAARVMSTPNLSSTGVSLPLLAVAGPALLAVSCDGWLLSRGSSSATSSSSSAKSAPIDGDAPAPLSATIL